MPSGTGCRSRLATKMLLCVPGLGRRDGDPGECMPAKSFGEGSLADLDALSEFVLGRLLPLRSLALGEMLRVAWLPSSSVSSTSMSSRSPISVSLLLEAVSYGW